MVKICGGKPDAVSTVLSIFFGMVAAYRTFLYLSSLMKSASFSVQLPSSHAPSISIYFMPNSRRASVSYGSSRASARSAASFEIHVEAGALLVIVYIVCVKIEWLV